MKTLKQPSSPRSDNYAEEDAVAEIATYWQARQAGGRMTVEDAERFQSWLAQDTSHRRVYGEITGLWQHPDLTAALKTIPLSSSRRRKPRACCVNVLFKPALWLTPAAAALIVAAVIWQPLLYWRADYITEVGEQRTLTLTDGSQVTLNTDSALELAFQPHERRVRLLKGEAYFAVNKNPTRPFVVDSGEIETRVLGTRFFVRNGEHQDTVTVVEGRVEVDGLSLRQKTVLNRGERISGTTAGLTEIIQAPATAGAWRDRHLVFENTPLPDVIAELDRYLPGFVFLADRSALNAVKVNARLNIKNPRAALDALEQTLPIRITHAGRWLALIRPQ